MLMDILRLHAAVQGDNAPSLAVVRLLGMTPIGEGRIWCPARGRDEPCLWFELPRERERCWAGRPAPRLRHSPASRVCPPPDSNRHDLAVCGF